MRTKFDIGDEVYLKVKVVSVGSSKKDKVEYGLKIKTGSGSWTFHALESELKRKKELHNGSTESGD